MLSSLALFERIFEYLDLPVEVDERPDARRVSGARGALAFDGVTFGYLPERTALEDASFEVEPGQVLALVGPSGAGKTTVTYLLQRFYDPQRGTFRAWLYTVTRNKLNTFLVRRSREARGAGDTAIEELLERQPAREEDAAARWQHDYEQRIFAWAAQQVRAASEDATWQAFRQTALEGKPATEVAKTLGMSVGAVYVAKSRVLARLKAQVRLIEDV